MKKLNSKFILPPINSFEEYEKFKLQLDVLKHAANEIVYRHQLPEQPLTLFADGTNIVFAYSEQHVIKIYPLFHHDQFKNELLVLQRLQGNLSVKTPTVEYQG